MHLRLFRLGMAPCKPTWPLLLGYNSNLFTCLQAFAKITVSLNILFYGLQPERPLSLYIEDAGCVPIDPKFCPKLSEKPLAIANGRMIFCMLAEIKADWKFHKDRLVKCQVAES